MKKLISLTLFAVLTSFATRAQTTYAVVVGVSDYESSADYQSGDLRFADSDAKLFVDFLKSPSGGSVSAQNIILLTNKQAAETKIKAAMDIYKNAKDEDRVIFFFSGHGMENALCPYDITGSNPSTALTYDEVKSGFKASAAKTKIMIADACHSGSMKNNKKAPITAESNAKFFGNDLNVAMILSSRSAQTSKESGRVQGGIFTFYLLNGLQGYADTNNDKIVTIKELFKYMSPRVKQSTENGQSPVFAGKFSDNLVLSKVK